MHKKNHKVNHESIIRHLVEDEATEKFLISWRQNVTAIFEHDEAIVRCYIFMRKYGIPQCRIQTYGDTTYEMPDLLNAMFQFFEEYEDYTVCARLKKCKPLPSWMLRDRYHAFASQLKDFYNDATIVMSQKEGFAMIQEILQGASAFFDLNTPYNYPLIMSKVIKHQTEQGLLDFGALKVLEAIWDETIQFTEREKKRYEQGIKETRYFYAPMQLTSEETQSSGT
jgi:hypothetical protein